MHVMAPESPFHSFQEQFDLLKLHEVMRSCGNLKYTCTAVSSVMPVAIKGLTEDLLCSLYYVFNVYIDIYI